MFACAEQLRTSWLLVSGDGKWWLCSQRRVAVCCSRTWVPNLMGVPRAQCLPCEGTDVWPREIQHRISCAGA